MPPTLAIAQRELLSLFYSPVAYIALALFGFLGALMFTGRLYPGQTATLQDLFFFLLFLLIFIAPAISMRLVSEEFNTGTIELLMTAPVKDAEVVVGKWLGALAFYVALFLPVLAMTAVLEGFADPDYGPIFTGLLGLLLVGALYLAVGTFVSTITASQLVSFLVTVLLLGLPTIGLYLTWNQAWMPDWVKPALAYLNVSRQYEDFGKGLIDLRAVVYFLSFTALFLYFGIKTLESRRWR